MNFDIFASEKLQYYLIVTYVRCLYSQYKYDVLPIQGSLTSRKGTYRWVHINNWLVAAKRS